MSDTREWRIIGTDNLPSGTWKTREEAEESARRSDEHWPGAAPHRVECRTVGPWVSAGSDGEDR